MPDSSANITPTALLRASIAMRLIDIKQKDQILEAWCKDPALSVADLLSIRGFMSPAQVASVIELLENGLFDTDFDDASQSSPIIGQTFGSDNDPTMVDSAPIVIGGGAPAPAFDDRFNSYTLKSNIGYGGLGIVNLYHDNALGRDVAIKEIRKEALSVSDKRQLVRFIQEAQITGQLQHPAIVPIYEMSIKPNGRPYFVMKNVQGNSLEDLLRKAQLLSTEAEQYAARMKFLDSLITVCEAAAYAHEKGVIHRDLKPANIIIGKFGESVILDWGLAKYVGKKEEKREQAYDVLTTVAMKPLAVSDEELTHADELVGTPAYMAPEQVDENYGEVDQGSDVYALGVILFRVLTGRMPYVADNIAGLLDQISQIGVPAPDPLAYNPAIPKELAAICKKAMSKNKQKRFSNASELAKVLEDYRDGRTVSVYSYTARDMAKRFIQQHRGVAMIAAALAVIVFVSAILITHLGAKSVKNQREAQLQEQLAKSEGENYQKALEDVKAAEEQNIKWLRTFPDVADRGLQVVETLGDGFHQEVTHITRNATEDINLRYNALSADFADMQKMGVVVSDVLTSAPGITAVSFVSTSKQLLGSYPADFNSRFKLEIWPVLDRHITRCVDTGRPVLTKLRQEQSFVSYIAPVRATRGRAIEGYIVITFAPEIVLGEWMKANYKGSEFYIWVMQDDGLIAWDTYQPDIRTNIYYDAKYSSYKELIELAKRYSKSAFGIGQYTYVDNTDASRRVQQKICAWRTLSLADNIKISVIASIVVGAQEKE